MAGKGGSRGRNAKPRAHRRRGGKTTRHYARDPSPPRSNGNVPSASRRRDGARHKKRRPSKSSKYHGRVAVEALQCSSSSIFTAWKKPLGSLIRYYVHTRSEDKVYGGKQAEEEVNQFYYRSGCCVEKTKVALLAALGVSDGNTVDLDMVIEKDDGVSLALQSGAESGASGPFAETKDGSGIVLKRALRPGEGPAHAHEQWTTVLVPQWAFGRSFFFLATNNTPLDLAVEVFLDGEQVARNVPLRANRSCTIRPDEGRYFQRHKWVLNDARRVKLGAGSGRVQDPPGKSAISNRSNPRAVPPRYNGIRPVAAEYDSLRISKELYPDPSSFGWTFTGSNEKSRVEFYERSLNLGVVKLDFYYTTGVVKTTLLHPTSGRNSLFRAQATPEQFAEIMKNPRSHTGQGYRRREDRPSGNPILADDLEDFDAVPPEPTAAGGDTEMGSDEPQTGTTYFARNDEYDFSTMGHKNRHAQMNKLEQSTDYLHWKSANQKEYAVVHARFFVATRERKHGPRSSSAKPRSNKEQEKQPLPEQVEVIDVKASANATLGTKYQATGPSEKYASRSKFRMKRVNGLKDGKLWKGEPVFEKKLYYRDEKVIRGDCLVDSDMETEEVGDDEGATAAAADSPLAQYKQEKIHQICNHRADLGDEADNRINQATTKIISAETVEDVDSQVAIFYNDLTHQQMVE